ncbi:tetratricopeptide repeat protein [Streptosporangium soli]|nr:tetratricopeptide repeat protein [Streptosporangium sp. KLBMP 9127]
MARRLDGLAGAYEGGDVSRAAIWSLAAEEWRQAGQPARALESLQRAVEDGGEVSVDPRAGIADTLFELDRPDEAREVIKTIHGEGDVAPATSLTIAETLVAYGDLRAAHEWATQGALASVAGSGEHTALLRARYRIRVDLGFPEDELDALLS